MVKSTGMRPYLEALANDADRRDFENHVLGGIEKAYPSQQNGRVLFPFERLFFVAYK
jgi:trans-aconitate 2-methyltransferase